MIITFFEKNCAICEKANRLVCYRNPQTGPKIFIIISILASFQRLGIDHLNYMRDVLTRLMQVITKDDVNTLTLVL